ncbi:MAG: tRNA (uridine(54)-C5)-methyltransferase TrmA [Pseudomonadota bacterium]
MLSVQPEQYESLFKAKCDLVEKHFIARGAPAALRIPSPPLAYRMRAEFRLWHQGDDLFYAMFDRPSPKTPIRIDTFPIACERIQDCMPRLLSALIGSPELRRKVFQAEFLSTLTGELLVTLAYHRPIDDAWEAAAGELATELNASIVGRSRGEKRVCGKDYVLETLPLAAGPMHYRQYEQAFTQPNATVNCAMIDWACQQAGQQQQDLLELYCGNGNFTLPLAAHFRHVLATEISKSSIQAATANQQMNNIYNLAFARLSAEDMSQAMAGARRFRRLADLQPPLEAHRFTTLFVDPPRAGLDPATLSLARQFQRVIYISCNPDSLLANLEALGNDFRVRSFALFDQFPYTHHMEAGVLLEAN